MSPYVEQGLPVNLFRKNARSIRPHCSGSDKPILTGGKRSVCGKAVISRAVRRLSRFAGHDMFKQGFLQPRAAEDLRSREEFLDNRYR